MAFTKLSNADFNDNGALSMPNRPSETKSAQEIKRLFDAPAREVVAPAYNRLIDELEAETGAASLGAVAPTGASGNTVQEILNGVYGAISTAVVDVREIKDEIEELSEEVGTFADDIETLQQEAHTHSNKDLLDTYEQTEANLADAVSKKHSHSNKELLDTYTQSNSDIAGAISSSHSHSNKSVLDKFGESGGKPTYDGSTISGAVDSVNGQTGAVVLDASDVGALPSSTDIPDSLSDLSDDSTHRLVTDTEKTTWNGKSTVSVTQVVSTGTKIATINVDGTDTDLYASGGGGGGSVNDAYKSVKVGSTTITASGEDTLELVAGSNVTLTPDASLKKVTISASGGGGSTGDMLASDYDSDFAVKTAGGIKAFVNAQISAQITSALTASY